MLRCTLIPDGAADRYLFGALSWLLQRCGHEIVIEWADPSIMRCEATDLCSRIRRAIFYYPADLYFIHRDSEGADVADRDREIDDAIARIQQVISFVKIIPVRMTEAWMLHEEAAIRLAAGNPNGKIDLNLPRINSLERLQDPKVELENALLKATELGQRRVAKKKRELRKMKLRVSELIEDYSPLMNLPAFRRLHQDVSRFEHNPV